MANSKNHNDTLQHALSNVIEANDTILASVECALMIQNRILPESNILNKYFKDSTILWSPRDIVGGDIYFTEELDENRVALFFFDCTGHGIPGALLTAILGAIKHRIIDEFKNGVNEVNLMLTNFYDYMRQTLGHKNKNFDFDGLIMIYNKSNKKLNIASNNSDIFVLKNNTTEIIKSPRRSRSDRVNDVFKFDIISIILEEGMRVYFSTDGFLDQKGDINNLPFGKKRFAKELENILSKPMESHKRHFVRLLKKYRGNSTRLDDVMIVGVEV